MQKLSLVISSLIILAFVAANIVDFQDKATAQSEPCHTIGNHNTMKTSEIKQIGIDKFNVSLKLLKGQAIVGKNPFALTFNSIKGQVPSNLKAEITATMPDMPKMLVPKPEITLNSKGTVKGNLLLTMPGLWEVKVALKQNNMALYTNTFKYNVN